MIYWYKFKYRILVFCKVFQTFYRKISLIFYLRFVIKLGKKKKKKEMAYEIILESDFLNKTSPIFFIEKED